MTDDRVLDLVERGKQIGSSFTFVKDDESFWVTLALQKIGAEYLAHVVVISEQNMACEKFEIYETRAFPTLALAIGHLQARSPSPFTTSSLSTFKGQKAFSPEAEEILRN